MSLFVISDNLLVRNVIQTRKMNKLWMSTIVPSYSTHIYSDVV